MSMLKRAGYFVMVWRPNALNYGCAQNRQRLWFTLFGMKFLLGTCLRRRLSIEEALWTVQHQLTLRLTRFAILVASTSLEHVLLPECHEYVQKYYSSLPEWEPKPVSATVKWTETLTPDFLPKPEQIQQHPGRKARTLRQVDILLEQDSFSSGFRPPATNGSQNKNRCVREGALANCPCLTRACQIWIPQRQRFLLGPEAIRLQLALDHKEEDEVISNFTDSEMMQLAGNTFNANTVTVVLLAVLMTTSSLVQ